MSDKKTLTAVIFTVTFIILGFGTFYQTDSMWGVNHLQYFGSLSYIYLALFFIIAVLILFLPFQQDSFDNIFESIDSWLWRKSLIPRFALAASGTVIFYLFKVQTAFLGDGYYLINLFSQKNLDYANTFVKPGSIFIVKNLQLLLGGYSEETSRAAFVIISVVCGFIVIVNLISIAGRISKTPGERFFILMTLLFSGSLLLFFGYYEFYPMLWAAATFFISCSLSYLQTGRRFWLCVAALVLTVLMHLQALYFLPGLLLLAIHKYLPDKLNAISSGNFRKIYFVITAFIILGIIITWNMVSITANPFLPFFNPGKQPFSYAMFSFKNLLEIGNLVFLIYPVAIFLIVFGFCSKIDNKKDVTVRLLGLFSLCSLSFLITIDPRLGMGRDFDLMSFTLFSPVLLLLYRITNKKIKLSVRTILVSVTISIFATLSFLTVSISPTLSAERTFSLLKNYGSKDRGGWLALAGYYEKEKDFIKLREVSTEMDHIFPAQRTLKDVNDLINEGEIERAYGIASSLVEGDPDNGEFITTLAHLNMLLGKFDQSEILYKKAIELFPIHRYYASLGGLYVFTRRFDEAITMLNKAHQLSPKNEEIITEICKVNLQTGDRIQARLMADTLLILDSNSAYGHLTHVIASDNQSDPEKIRFHMMQFIKYGTGVIDYERIKQKYLFLLPDSLK